MASLAPPQTGAPEPARGKRALLFINEKASQTQACSKEIMAALTEGGLQVEQASAKSGEDYATRLRERPGEFDLVVVAGGDGTVRCAVEAIHEVAPGRVPLGIIPLGTANNVGRSLSLPLKVPEACEVICAGHSVPMDLGRVNGRIFVSVVGIGLSTKVHQAVPDEHKKRWGSLSYAFHAARLLFQRPPFFRAVIRSEDGLHRFKVLQLTVCNGRHYGAHLQIHPQATLTDGLLDLSVIEGGNYLRGFFKALLPLAAKHASPGLRLLSSRRFEVTCQPVMPLDVEGSTDLQTPATFEVLPKALQVFAPAP